MFSFPPGVWGESADRKVTQKALISPEEQVEAATDLPASSWSDFVVNLTSRSR